MLGANYNTYKDLLKLMEDSGKDFDIKQVDKAYNFAFEAHNGQVRASGEPYIVHPISVACILVELGMDTESIVAAILHDVVEDTEATLELIKKEFGETISILIDGVTKIGKYGFDTKEERQAENIRKMLMAMNNDLRVIIIKLADRLNNIRTISALRGEKQLCIAHETIEIFAPIADRLGMRYIKEELEDLAFRVLDPVAYAEIQKELEERNFTSKDFISRTIEVIRNELGSEHANAEVAGRVKSMYGIYKKVYIQGRSFDDVYDIYAVRIILEKRDECYPVLGIIHNKFHPIPNRFKDYITMPKQNGYQSLHTTVSSPEDKIAFEVQIRTKEMHYQAEYGVAAHWKYKLGMTDDKDMYKQTEWIAKIFENQIEEGDKYDIVNQIKSDFMPDEVYPMTPKFQTKPLPQGSTTIDFAYAIHTQVGHKMVGAKINGKIVPISYGVDTGDIVEILTTKDPNHGPSRDWLKIVKTSQAKSKIRSWFKHEKREENIQEGQSAMNRMLRRNNMPCSGDIIEEIINNIALKYKFNSIDDFYAAIGYGGLSVNQISPVVFEAYKKACMDAKQAENEELDINITTMSVSNNHYGDSVIINGLGNVQFKFAKCCNPVPGDDIIGFVTRGYGVSIHKLDCVNVPVDLKNAQEPDRWVNAVWSVKTHQREYKATIEIYAIDRSGLLADVTRLLSDMHVNIEHIECNSLKDGNASIILSFMTSGVEHLTSVMLRLKKMKDIISVDRTGG